jgi:hypothetical protein
MLSDGSRHGRQHKAPTPAILHIPGLCISPNMRCTTYSAVWAYTPEQLRHRVAALSLFSPMKWRKRHAKGTGFETHEARGSRHIGTGFETHGTGFETHEARGSRHIGTGFETHLHLLISGFFLVMSDVYIAQAESANLSLILFLIKEGARSSTHEGQKNNTWQRAIPSDRASHSRKMQERLTAAHLKCPVSNTQCAAKIISQKVIGLRPQRNPLCRASGQRPGRRQQTVTHPTLCSTRRDQRLPTAGKAV